MKSFAGKWLVKVLALGGVALYAASKSKASRKGERTLTVTGEGEVDCAPDFARVRVAVRTRHEVAKKASADLQEKLTAILEALTGKAELPKADLQTNHLSIRQDRHKPDDKDEYIVEYVAYSEITIKVRELDKLGQVLDVANDAGIDELEDLEFDVQDSKGYKRRAMALAVRDARSQAEVLASSAGMRLGSVLRITDGPDYDIQRSGGMLSHSMGYGGAVATGTISVHAQAQVKFELLEQRETVSI